MFTSGFNIKNFLFRLYLRKVYSPDFTAAKSIRHQQKIFENIINRLGNTELGKDLKFAQIKSYNDFRNSVPVTQYDFYEGYVEKIKAGKENIMTDRPVRYFAKTAGTTSGKSKLVPITKEIMRQNHVRGSFFALSKIHQLDKSIQLLSHKNLLIPGGIYETLPNGILIADISAVLSRNIPAIYRRYYTPGLQTQTLGKWEEKINRTVHEIKNEDVGTFSGVPTWYLATLNKLKDETGFNKLTDLWKNLQVFFHGGVSFEPYRKQFEELVGKKDFVFFEIYNATEGFIAIQETLHTNDLLLLTDNLLFFEFIPLDKYYAGERNALQLSEVKSGVPYVLLLTAPNGLIRYLIGDVITFTKTDPFTFKITGRTQEYINAFGEDLLLANVQNALMNTNKQLNASIRDYTVAPFYINIEQKGRIQFAVEFSQTPVDLKLYAQTLDENLKKENSNYLQKRTNDLALSCLEVIALPEGTFYKWLSSKNKLGGQNKVPRLVNGRGVMEEILKIILPA
ncbi:MAG TPA: GH3 auxin-responsive promoter family protein [Chitinophagales bacterium]|nr:GH3 auxin-responsive promoter family protein [Chitinophagales bacterium]